MHTARLTIATFALSLCATTAQGMSLTWTLQNALFNDATALTGSFDFNAATGGAAGFSNVHLVTQDGSGLTGQTYTGVTILSGAVGFTSMAGDQFLAIVLDGLMTDLGGTIDIDMGFEAKVSNGSARNLASGQIVGGSPVSLVEPAAAATFAMGLLVALFIRTRRAII